MVLASPLCLIDTHAFRYPAADQLMESITESSDYDVIIKSLRSQGFLPPAEEIEPNDDNDLQPSHEVSREPSQTTTPLPVGTEAENGQNGLVDETDNAYASSAPTEAHPSLSTTPAPPTTQTGAANLPSIASDDTTPPLDFSKVQSRVRDFGFDSKRQFLTEVFRVLNNIA